MELKFSAAISLPVDEVDVMACLRILDGGAEHIYLTDDKGKYIGRAITRQSFRAMFDGKDAAASIPSVEYNNLFGGQNEDRPRHC